MSTAEDASPEDASSREPETLPQDFEGLRDLILTRHDSLPKRLAQVARFAVEHPDDIAFGTAASIADVAEVQPSTLVRLAHSLGYQGFSDLQSVFRERLRSRPASYDERLAKAQAAIAADTSGPATIASGMLTAASHSIERLAGTLDPEALEAAAAILASADTIYLLAQKRSYPVASYLGYVFGKLKMRAVVVGAAQGGEEDALSLSGPKDAALSISFTPYAPKTVEWTRTLCERGVPVVGITDSVFSPIRDLSSAVIEVVETDYEGFRSLGATMALSAGLAVAAANRRRQP